MGLTLPILLEDPFLKHREFGRSIGILYGINTLGAMAGALLGETYLVRSFGLVGTGWTAAGVCCGAAVSAWILAGQEPGESGKLHRDSSYAFPQNHRCHGVCFL